MSGLWVSGKGVVSPGDRDCNWGKAEKREELAIWGEEEVRRHRLLVGVFFSREYFPGSGLR